ncbi:MAG: TldD/PmbA family protein [Rubrimonas sp.]
MKDLPDLAAQLVDRAIKAGADAADALALRGEDQSIAVRGGRLEQAGRSEGVDFGVRVLIGGRQACASASDPRPDVVAALVERAIAMAREAPEDPWCGLPDASELGAPPDVGALALQADAPAPSPAQLQALAREAEAAALSVPGVAQVDGAEAAYGRTELAMAASNGFAGAYARTTASLSVSAIAADDAGMEADYDYAVRRALAELPPAERIGREAGLRAARRLGARKAPAGAAPVVFDRRVAPSLIGHLLAAANGAAVARGASWLLGRMDTPVLPAWVALTEDPHLPGGPASRPFDGEGVATQASPIVSEGVLRRWLLDCASARQLGLRTTANARRGVAGPPSPGFSNVRMTPGAAAPEALIAGVERGLFVTAMLGASVNPTTGDYSRGAAGFWIENGELAYPVAEATIAGRLPDVLPTIVAANDPDPFVALSVPTLRVEGLVVA